MKQNWIKGLSLMLAVMVLAAACRKKDAPLPDNLVQFEAASQGFTPEETIKTIKLKLSAGVSANTPVVVSVTPSANLVYGHHFVTTPVIEAGKITAIVNGGASEATILVTKISGAVFIGDETLDFKVESSGAPVIIGTQNQFKLSFSQIVSEGSILIGQGGGATYGNKVFFDLSANAQTSVTRTAWDLGLYSGADDFRAILNSSTAMMAKQIAKNDLTAVTAADTVGFYNDVIFNQTEPTITSLPYIDYPDGDLAKTAIAQISATADDNKVYIINRGTGVGSPAPARGWKKVRIIRNANGGYTVQHADIAATTFTSIDVAKDDAYNFKYISFDNGAVSVEPKKAQWDIAWTYFSNVTNFGAGEVPYTFQDIVLSNRNVQIAKVMTSAKTFEAFAEADLAGLTWLTTQNAIGADWRSGGGPGTAPAVRADRFYILKDGSGNYYKVRFTAMTQAGERGYPAFEYVLLKKG